MATRPIAWQRRYRLKLVATDTLVVVLAVFAAQLLRFGVAEKDLEIEPYKASTFPIAYTLLSVALIIGWLLALSVFSTRDHRIVGIGAEEYKRVVNSTFATFGMLAVLAYLSRSQVGRGYVLAALPIGLFLLILGRWLWRQRLHQQRLKQRNVYRTIIVGEKGKCVHVARQISRDRFSGFGLLGAITDSTTDQTLLPGLPILGRYDELLALVDRHHVDRLIVTSADSISPQRLRRIGWELEARGVELVVAAALTDVAGPRIHMRPVAGLPLIHVDYPKFTGRNRFTKRTFDVLGSSALLLLLSPVFLVVAIAVKSTSKGPIFYSQERIGLAGKPFPMFKFRSMVENADDQLKSLLDLQGTSTQPLHKINNDPRVTPVGRFIRRYSLDELPQLANVLLGTMSIVGPRPQREAEVALYERYDHRRLMVKPGITGLWQVSGRSNLDWEDAIRLDLYYVENWSMTGDFIILWRTVKTVIKPEGAY